LWFNTISEEAIIRRKLARQKWLENMDNKDNFRRLRTRQKDAHNIIWCEKRKFIKKITENVENDYRNHRARKLYQQVNKLSGKYKKKERFLRDDKGSLLTTETILEKWNRYFDSLLNCDELEEVFISSTKKGKITLNVWNRH